MKIVLILAWVSLFSCNNYSKIDTSDTFKIEADSEKVINSQINHHGIVKQYDSFHKIILPYISQDLADEIYNQSKDIYHLRRIRVGHDYTISFKDSSFYKFKYNIDSKGYFYVLAQNDTLEYSIVHYQFEKDTVFADIKIDNMLIESISELGIDELIAINLSSIFAWDIDFTFDIRKNDRFNIFYEKLYLNGEYKGVGEIISASYINDKDTLSIYRYISEGNVEYFDSNGSNIKKEFLKAPVDFRRISSGFSYRRFHPILKKYKSHFGMDYVAEKNTPVYAIADGKIVYSGFKKYNGNYVHIRHKGGFESKYLHFNSISPKIKRNRYVKQGDVIGYVGKTGLATGYHVCFRFYLNGYPYNFSKVKNPITSKLESNTLEDYADHKNLYPFDINSYYK